MQRREFLVGAAAGAAAAAGFARTGRAQTARKADPKKLARIALMTLDFGSMLKLPGQPDSPARTLDVFDIAEMYADVYDVHNIEMQHSHILSTEDSYLTELRSRYAKFNSRVTNINLEFGGMNISADDPVMRAQALDLTCRWVDHAVVLGSPRVMINQGQPTDVNKAWGIPTIRKMGEYGKSKGIMVSVETRGNGANTGGSRGSVPTGGGGRGGAAPQARARGAAPVAGAPAAAAPAGAPAAAAAAGGRQGAPGAGAGGGRGAGTVNRGLPTVGNLTVVPAWVLLAQ